MIEERRQREIVIFPHYRASIEAAIELINTFTVDGRLPSDLHRLAEEAKWVAERYQEKAHILREYIQESATADQSEEKALDLSEWIEALKEAAREIEQGIEDGTDVGRLIYIASNVLAECPGG